jgi:hypothetical protein
MKVSALRSAVLFIVLTVLCYDNLKRAAMRCPHSVVCSVVADAWHAYITSTHTKLLHNHR